jgi:lipopolysaccharide transport system ATP-binding protein
MGDVSKSDGRTVLFVSHNMTAINKLCSKTILLKNGLVSYIGDNDTAAQRYNVDASSLYSNENIKDYIKKYKGETFELDSINIYQDDGKDTYDVNNDIFIEIGYTIHKPTYGIRVGFDLLEMEKELLIFRSFHDDLAQEIELHHRGQYVTKAKIPGNLLNHGKYGIKIIAGIHNKEWLVFDEKLTYIFETNNKSGVNSTYHEKRPGVISPAIKWI